MSASVGLDQRGLYLSVCPIVGMTPDARISMFLGECRNVGGPSDVGCRVKATVGIVDFKPAVRIRCFVRTRISANQAGQEKLTLAGLTLPVPS